MKSRNILGIVLISLGILFLLGQTDILPSLSFVINLWPLIIIAVGLSYLSNARKSLFVALILIGVGIILQLDQFDFLPWGFWSTFWPLMIIIIGISILTSQFGKRQWQRSAMAGENKDKYFDITSIFSGQTEKVTSKDFQGGKIMSIFGGAEIDLRDASMAAEGANIDITCIFGGVEMWVPRNCVVKTSGTPIFGGVDNKTYSDNPDSADIIYINFSVMFGGVEIKN